jgi:transcriptional regulator with XRE-family HTH domain
MKKIIYKTDKKYLKNIKIYRILKGITINEMSDKLSISNRAYYYIEEGHTDLSIERLIKISEILNCNINDILEFNHNIIN